MDSGSLMVLYSILFGLALGSFMNVCIYRIPHKQSIINPPSTCPYCGWRIRFYDNIPLVSYVLLWGKCRHCRHSIPWHYPAVEAMAGLLSLSLFIRYGLSYQYFLFLLFVATLVTIAFIDLHHKIIPDVLSLPGILVGWAASFVLGHISWSDSLIGMIGGGGTLFVIAFGYAHITGKEGMGGGDRRMDGLEASAAYCADIFFNRGCCGDCFSIPGRQRAAGQNSFWSFSFTWRPGLFVFWP
jgi:leader peptidase (prepilin peptidase)/N-methyltransferase